MQKNIFYATGSRKEAVAKVRIFEGKGKIIVNGQFIQKYFYRPDLETLIVKPFAVTDTLGKIDVIAKVKGGGKSGQASALMLGIARALLKSNEEFRKTLRSAGLLTRDSREVERKKYGRVKARKRFQFSKR
ncbi:30S ribosomal protein S9 [candidate division WOR-3 bacterium]|nr:30S ribosomal protein S9 [candidate division WOR-3 bacterium]